jgi:hypothetical protein
VVAAAAFIAKPIANKNCSVILMDGQFIADPFSAQFAIQTLFCEPATGLISELELIQRREQHHRRQPIDQG